MTSTQHYVKELGVRTQPWSPPTKIDLADQAWISAFDEASQLGRENIANSWLWHAWQKAGDPDMGDKLPWLISLRGMYTRAQPLMSPAIFGKFNFSGDLHNELLYDEFICLPDEAERKSALISDLDRFWFGNAEQSMTALRRIMADVDANLSKAYLPDQDFYPLVQHLVFDRLATAPTEHARELLETGIKLSAVCGLSKLPSTAIPDNKVAWAWQTLASYAARYARPEGNTVLPKGVQDVIRATDLKTALVQFKYILQYNMAAERSGPHAGEWGYTPNGIFNSSKQRTYDLFAPLDFWFPEQSDFWASARALGQPLKEAMETAIRTLTLQTTQQANQTSAQELPSTISGEVNASIS